MALPNLLSKYGIQAPAQISTGGLPNLLSKYGKDYTIAQQLKSAQTNAAQQNSIAGILSNTASDLVSTFKNIGSNVLSSFLAAPRPQSLDMQQSLKAGWEGIVSTVEDTAKKYQAVGTAFTTPTTGLQKTAAVGEAGLATLNNFFLGVTAPLKAAEGVPVVGYAASAVNNLFSALGTGGSMVASKAVDGLPISDESKKTVRPLAEEIGALVAQIVAGKAGSDAVGLVKTKVGDLNTALRGADVVVTNKNLVAPAPRTGTETTVETTLNIPSFSQETQAALIRQTTDGVRPTKAATDLNAGLVQKGFDALPADQLARYTPTTKAEQIARVTDIMGDIDRATKIALGQEPIPSGVQSTVLFNALTEHAFKNNDYSLIRDLANSPLAEQSSLAGQSLGATGFNKPASNPVEAIREIQKVRQERAAELQQTSKKVSDTIKKEISKRNTKQTWAEFVKSIEC